MSNSVERRTQDERRALAERRVVEAAVALIADHGSRSATLARVGEKAGYSRGIVTHHFGTRDGLLRRVVEYARQVDVPEYDGDGLRQLTGTVESYLCNIVERKSSARAFLRMWSEAIASDPVLEPVFGEQDAHLRKLLADILRAGVADGSVGSEVDAAAGAVFVAACLRGIGMQLIATPAVGSTQQVIEEAVRLVGAAFAPRSRRET